MVLKYDTGRENPISLTYDPRLFLFGALSISGEDYTII